MYVQCEPKSRIRNFAFLYKFRDFVLISTVWEQGRKRVGRVAKNGKKRHNKKWYEM